MKQESPDPEKELGEDLKTFEELPDETKELALLQQQAEKATGPASVVLNKKIREKARAASPQPNAGRNPDAVPHGKS